MNLNETILYAVKILAWFCVGYFGADLFEKWKNRPKKVKVNKTLFSHMVVLKKTLENGSASLGFVNGYSYGENISKVKIDVLEKSKKGYEEYELFYFDFIEITKKEIEKIKGLHNAARRFKANNCTVWRFKHRFKSFIDNEKRKQFVAESIMGEEFESRFYHF